MTVGCFVDGCLKEEDYERATPQSLLSHGFAKRKEEPPPLLECNAPALLLFISDEERYAKSMAEHFLLIAEKIYLLNIIFSISFLNIIYMNSD